ncbi:hypothetical protein [Amycolatopsis jejuensis]|uniref:hypothetical protein n=1 Tax=Amycolatopsis jejuensis TaxID=330084 RepID=UPI000B18918B|nr:hypothetical protein [Amycolatopsis jejuensis]
MKRLAAVVAAVAVIGLGCAACGDSDPAPSSGPAVTSQLDGIQSTLDSVESDMAGDGSQ